MAIDMNQLYSKDKEATQAAYTPNVVSSNAEAATATSRDAVADQAASNTANAAQGNASSVELDRDNTNVDSQMNRMTSQDSLYMQSAKQGGLMQAAARGLGNTSLAAGAAQREAVRAALPMAQQNASQEANRGLADAAARNEMEKLNTSLEVDVSKFNAEQLNAISKLNAQLKTAVSQGNAEQANKIASEIAQMKTNVSMQNAVEANRVNTLNADRTSQTSQFNASAQNEQDRQTQMENAELNKQYLSGEQAAQIATIQGKYNVLIANNNAAASMYTAHMQYAADVSSDPKTSPGVAAAKIDLGNAILEEGLIMLDGLNGVEIEGAPAATVGGTAPAPTGTAAPAPAPAPAPSYANPAPAPTPTYAPPVAPTTSYTLENFSDPNFDWNAYLGDLGLGNLYSGGFGYP